MERMAKVIFTVSMFKSSPPKKVEMEIPESVYRVNESKFSDLVGRSVTQLTYIPDRETQKEFWIAEVIDGKTELGFEDWLDS